MAITTSVEAVIEEKLEQIDAEIEQLRDERARLEQALAALGAVSSNGSGSRAATGRRPRSRRRRTAGKQRGGRAPRGSNLAAIVGYVESNPGVTTSDIASATGIAKTVVYSAVARLSKGGRLRREPLPDGRVTYHPPAR